MKHTMLFVISGGLYVVIWDVIVCQNVTRGRMYSMFINLKLLLDNKTVRRYNNTHDIVLYQDAQEIQGEI
jgi:hypothetical protein